MLMLALSLVFWALTVPDTVPETVPETIPETVPDLLSDFKLSELVAASGAMRETE